jgi:hypothetical protein
MVEHLDECDLGAEGIEEVGKLCTDCTCTDDNDRLGLLFHLQRLAGSHDALAIDL